MRPDHPVLREPFPVLARNGLIQVLRRRPAAQAEMGEALTLDGIAGSVDAEAVALGLSDKGAGRGAIVRHGPYTLWGYGGGAGDLTPEGESLLVNTVHYAARWRGAPVLERRRHKTRDDLHSYLDSARTYAPGLLGTIRQYLPEGMAIGDPEAVAAWLSENRPYLRVEGRRFLVDPLARELGLPNHRLAFLEACAAALEGPRAGAARAALERSTGQELGAEPAAWRAWLAANREWLFFSDCDGYRFLVDVEARARGVPAARLRNWSSENTDYRRREGWAHLAPAQAGWFREELAKLGGGAASGAFQEAVRAVLGGLGAETAGSDLAGPWARAGAADEAVLADLLVRGAPVERAFAAAAAVGRGLAGLGLVVAAWLGPCSLRPGPGPEADSKPRPAGR